MRTEHYRLQCVTVAPLGESPQRQVDRWHAALVGSNPGAVVIEGAFIPVNPPSDVPLLRVAGGCVCCTGHLVLKVELTRLLRRFRPDRVLMLVAGDDDHIERFAAQLAAGELGIEIAQVDISAD